MTARKDTPPEPGTPEWKEACERVRDKKKSPQPFCGQAGGRRADGWPCESVYVKGNGLCKMHGGNVRKGVLSGPWKHGRDSAFAKILPARFRAAYEASLNDDDLLSLRSEIALADVRTYEILESLSSGESGEAWKKTLRFSKEIERETKKEEPDLEAIRALAGDLVAVASSGADDVAKWREVREQTDHRRKLAESERARLKELQSTINAEEALTIVARLVDIVMRYVTDNAVRADMLYEIEALVGHNAAEERRARYMLAGREDGSLN